MLKISVLGQKVEFYPIQNVWATLIGLPLATETINLTTPLSNLLLQGQRHKEWSGSVYIVRVQKIYDFKSVLSVTRSTGCQEGSRGLIFRQ